MEDGKAKRASVKVGRPAGTLVKIDSGLVGGEQVIIEGQARLRDGAPVQLRKPAGAGGRRGGRNGGGPNGGSANGGSANGGGRGDSGAKPGAAGGQGGPAR
jgi:multidrug efflux system membrane fusion protein